MKSIVVVLTALGLASCAGGFNRGSPNGPSAAAGGSSAAPCVAAAGEATASGGMSCRGGTYYRCSNGAWQETALSCSR
jgi:hypothetical protein